MVYDFKLRTGFFKTQKCKLYIGDKKLKIISEEHNCPIKATINEEELISISITRENLKLMDIEISTKGGNYSGTFEESDKIKEVLCELVGEFGRKVKF